MTQFMIRREAIVRRLTKSFTPTTPFEMSALMDVVDKVRSAPNSSLGLPFPSEIVPDAIVEFLKSVIAYEVAKLKLESATTRCLNCKDALNITIREAIGVNPRVSDLRFDPFEFSVYSPAQMAEQTLSATRSLLEADGPDLAAVASGAGAEYSAIDGKGEVPPAFLQDMAEYLNVDSEARGTVTAVLADPEIAKQIGSNAPLPLQFLAQQVLELAA